MRRLSRRWGAFFGGLIAAVTLVFAIAILVTQTTPGRERILALTLETLGGQLNGKLVAEERLGGSLFTGAKLFDIVLTDPAGRVMVAADSAFIEYRLGTLFGGDIVINDLVLYGSEVLLYRLPGDSLWNYQAVLQDTTPEVPGQRGRATIIEAMRLVDAHVTIRMPWEPADDLSAEAREREIEAALSDTSRLAVESVPGGYLRTIVVRTPETTLEALTVAPDERGGTYLRIAEAAAVVQLYRDRPLVIESMEGELSLRAGVVRYAAPRIVMPASRVATSGVIDLNGEEPLYDLQADGADVAWRDLRWLYPAFPEEGEATFEIQLETRPDDMFIRASELELEAPGTRVVGRFTMVMGDTLLFSNVDVSADPIDMDVVEGMLPVALPVEGLEIGGVEIESPAS